MNIEGIGRDITEVGDLLYLERRHVLELVVALQQATGLSDRRRAEPGTWPKRHPAVKRHSEHDDVSMTDIGDPWQSRERGQAREARNLLGVRRAHESVRLFVIGHHAPIPGRKTVTCQYIPRASCAAAGCAATTPSADTANPALTGAAKFNLVKASASARSATRSSVLRERRVVTSSTIVPRQSRAAKCSSTAAHGCWPRPGMRCSSREESVPSVMCRWVSRSPSASAIANESAPATAACDTSSVVCG